MTAVARDDKTLARLVEEKEDEIIIEGKTADGTYRIIIAGKFAIAALCVTLAAVIIGTVATAGLAAPATASALTAAAAGTLGTTGGAVASGLIIAAGGVTILNKLRNYKVIEHRSGYLVIKRS